MILLISYLLLIHEANLVAVHMERLAQVLVLVAQFDHLLLQFALVQLAHELDDRIWICSNGNENQIKTSSLSLSTFLTNKQKKKKTKILRTRHVDQ